MQLRRRTGRAPGGAARRIGLVLRWPTGLALVSWRYMWRTTPMHRSETTDEAAEQPRAVPDALLDADVQRVEDGVGPLVNRRYSVRIAGAALPPAQLITRFAGDPNCATPAEVAVFEKIRGATDEMQVGDEFLIRMPGPWDGPVRVIDRTPTSFRLTTLRGHIEAGQIEFRCRAAGGGQLTFEIESWARSGDWLSNLLYTRLRLAKEIQLNLWVETCLRLVRNVGGRPRGGVRIETRRLRTP